jgi:hypothetical protein
VISAPPAMRTSSIRSALVYSFRSSSTSGNRRRQAPSTGTRTHAVIVSAQAIRIRPPTPAATRRPASTARSAAATATRASAAAASPAAVGLVPRGSRSITGVPSSRSMAAIWCDNAGCDMCSTAAALVSEPCSTTATRDSSVLIETI